MRDDEGTPQLEAQTHMSHNPYSLPLSLSIFGREADMKANREWVRE